MKEPETIEEFKRAIDFLRLGIENELLRRKIGDMIDDVGDYRLLLTRPKPDNLEE